MDGEEEATWADYSFVAPFLEVRRSGNGRGMFVRDRPVTRGEVLVVWTGRVVSSAGLAGVPDDEHSYVLQLHDDIYMIPFEYGRREPADFVNHSCNPNAGLAGEAILVAMKDIGVDEEITFDYSMADSSEVDEFTCNCHAPQCRGVVRGTDWKQPALWEKYGSHWSPYLLQKIAVLQQAQQATTSSTGGKD